MAWVDDLAPSLQSLHESVSAAPPTALAGHMVLIMSVMDEFVQCNFLAQTIKRVHSLSKVVRCVCRK